jgi:hypothetical protein
VVGKTVLNVHSNQIVTKVVIAPIPNATIAAKPVMLEERDCKTASGGNSSILRLDKVFVPNF